MVFRHIALLVMALASSLAGAQSSVDPLASASPHFAREGDTVYVSGHMIKWFGKLMAIFTPRTFDGNQALIDNPIKNVVFVNAYSDRPEGVRGAWFLEPRFRAYGVNTVVVGQCDLFCARIFALGKNRQFGLAVGKEPTRVEFQIPVDFSTKKLERRFPHTELAVYEAFIPAFATLNKALLTKAFSEPLDVTGGLFVGGNEVRYCASVTTGACSELPGMTAYSMGLTTNPEQIRVQLPSQFSTSL